MWFQKRDNWQTDLASAGRRGGGGSRRWRGVGVVEGDGEVVEVGVAREVEHVEHVELIVQTH